MGQNSKDAALPCASAHVPAAKSLSRWEAAELPQQVWVTTVLPALSTVRCYRMSWSLWEILELANG